MEGPEQTRSYMEALEEERCKIQVFRRELPLCLDLVTRAIEMCKYQLSGTSYSMEDSSELVLSECLEKSSAEEWGGAVLEEFIPIKRRTSSTDNHTDHDHNDDSDEQLDSQNDVDDQRMKSTWLKSVQLWNHSPDADDSLEDSPPPPSPRRLELNGSNKTNTSAFQPFPIAGKSSLSSSEAAEAAPLAPAAATSASSTAEKGGEGDGSKMEETKQIRPSSKKKQRRSWSVELHRLFVHTLHQLGGPYVATPKQIKELMKVEDLTSDEIKSHLQKYRLHAKNSTRPIGGNAQPSQFVFVGQIWVPPPPQPQHAVAVIPGEAHGAYAPAAVAQTRVLWPESQKIQKHMGSGSEGQEAHGISNSTTMSASAHSVTVC
ncbi:hypothetical protein SAY87_015846 [Trapa incisa]|uniref:HTH myb-type domain-containing protein n=1 Tax=Trapa incisa TaxID=236973 RepID=A0AAN7LE32_9MYRT|nr:hypothetical protein SAY87_015846 [Trapa incisa]